MQSFSRQKKIITWLNIYKNMACLKVRRTFSQVRAWQIDILASKQHTLQSAWLSPASCLPSDVPAQHSAHSAPHRYVTVLILHEPFLHADLNSHWTNRCTEQQTLTAATATWGTRLFMICSVIFSLKIKACNNSDNRNKRVLQTCPD